MTTALKKAIAKVYKMSITEQNALAHLISEEIILKNSSKQKSKLQSLIAEAVDEFKKGKCQDLAL